MAQISTYCASAIVVLFLALVFSNMAQYSPNVDYKCVSNCNASVGLWINVCGNDKRDHYMKSDQYACYNNCNLTTYYPGSCSCPNVRFIALLFLLYASSLFFVIISAIVFHISYLYRTASTITTPARSAVHVIYLHVLVLMVGKVQTVHYLPVPLIPAMVEVNACHYLQARITYSRTFVNAMLASLVDQLPACIKNTIYHHYPMDN